MVWGTLVRQNGMAPSSFRPATKSQSEGAGWPMCWGWRWWRVGWSWWKVVKVQVQVEVLKVLVEVEERVEVVEVEVEVYLCEANGGVVALDIEALLDGDWEAVEGPAGLGGHRLQGPGPGPSLADILAHCVQAPGGRRQQGGGRGRMAGGEGGGGK